MTATVYAPRMTKRKRNLTDAERAQVRAAEQRLAAAIIEKDAALKARNELLIRLDEDGDGVGATEMARAMATESEEVGLHRTTVSRIVIPARTKRER